MIVGPRQSGKTSLVWSILKDRPPQSVLFLNGEERVVRMWANSAGLMAANIREAFPEVTTLFFDEAQHIEDAGLLIKGLIDSGHGFDVWVTGSSAFHLMDKTRESMAGRASQHQLLPFSLEELLAAEKTRTPVALDSAAIKHVRRMMVRGSYPQVWEGNDHWVTLKSLINAFVTRDASDMFRIRNPEAFRKLMQLAAGQIGQMANQSEWAAHVGVSSSTVGQYLGMLEDAWIIRQVPAFAGGARREVTSAVRVHFYDMGLRNALTGSRSEDLDRRLDRGALAEGFAFSEIAKTLDPLWSLHYWRAKGGAEVDFVLINGLRKIGIEIKSGPRIKISRSARSFIQAYHPELFLVVSLDTDQAGTQLLEQTPIKFIPLSHLAKEVREVMDADISV
ncbi:MAG: ATP-binding protein [Deltaproteobacteria bacterium]|nr:ATP-binding protein [Deltaproteobacteria bacterium]